MSANSQLALMPFLPGNTLGVTATTDGVEWEGVEFVIPDWDYGLTAGTNVFKPRTGLTVAPSKTVRCVRNVSGVNLLPGLLVAYQATAAGMGKRVAGYTVTEAAQGYPVDEFLTSAGVVNNDIFLITVHGNASIKLSVTAAETVISAGSYIMAVTAAASTHSTTAGRYIAAALTGATAVLANQVVNIVGMALSASTTADTGRLSLCFVRRTW